MVPVVSNHHGENDMGAYEKMINDSFLFFMDKVEEQGCREIATMEEMERICNRWHSARACPMPAWSVIVLEEGAKLRAVQP